MSNESSEHDAFAVVANLLTLSRRQQLGSVLRFVSLSGLLHPSLSTSVRNRHRANLKSRIKELLGAKTVNEYHAVELRSAITQGGALALLQILYLVKQRLDELAAADVRVLVLDMTFEAGLRERNLVVALLRDIWGGGRGIDILIPLEEGLSISFDKMAEVVSGNEFLEVYAKHLCRVA